MSTSLRDRVTARRAAAKQTARAAEESAARALADQQAAERAQREAAEAEKQARTEHKKRETQLAADVERLEAEANAVLSQPALDGRPSHDMRVDTRRFLIEGADLRELTVPADPVAGGLHAAGYRATRLLELIEADLGTEHALADRADAVEVNLWAAFVQRVRTLAGE